MAQQHDSGGKTLSTQRVLRASAMALALAAGLGVAAVGQAEDPGVEVTIERTLDASVTDIQANAPRWVEELRESVKALSRLDEAARRGRGAGWVPPFTMRKERGWDYMGCAPSTPNARDVAYTMTRPVAPKARAPTFPAAHTEMANGVASSGAAGEWLSCSEDKTVALVDWTAGRVVHSWRGHQKGVHRVVASPNGNVILSGSRDTTVRVWRRGQAEAALTLRGHELSVMAVAVAEDGQQALSGSRDCSLRHWDLATGTTKGRCHLEQNVVTCLKWVPGETSLVAQGSEDLRLRLWDVRTLSRPAAVLENEYVYFPLCCDCSGPYVLTGSNGFNTVGCELRLWDRRTRKQVR